jgi:ubiquinone biosynthesis protein UbiJ
MNIWAFLIGASLISTVGWVANNWIRARHGYPILDEEDDKPNRKKLDAICAENAELRQQLTHLQERMAVMERIATDPAERTAREIESLR